MIFKFISPVPTSPGTPDLSMRMSQRHLKWRYEQMNSWFPQFPHISFPHLSSWKILTWSSGWLLFLSSGHQQIWLYFFVLCPEMVHFGALLPLWVKPPSCLTWPPCSNLASLVSSLPKSQSCPYTLKPDEVIVWSKPSVWIKSSAFAMAG